MTSSGSQALWCNIANISTVAQTARIRIYNHSGAVVYDSGDVVIAPRVAFWASVGGTGHCRFTTVNAKTLFRASINVYDGSTVLASIPAQRVPVLLSKHCPATETLVLLSARPSHADVLPQHSPRGDDI